MGQKWGVGITALENMNLGGGKLNAVWKTLPWGGSWLVPPKHWQLATRFSFVARESGPKIQFATAARNEGQGSLGHFGHGHLWTGAAFCRGLKSNKHFPSSAHMTFQAYCSTRIMLKILPHKSDWRGSARRAGIGNYSAAGSGALALISAKKGDSTFNQKSH